MGTVGARAALLNIPRGGRRAEPRESPPRVKAHDVRFFHPGQVLLSAITLGYTVGDLAGGGLAAEADLSSLELSIVDAVAGYSPLDLSVLDLATSVPGIIL